MKKVLAIVLSLVMMGSMAACSGSSETSSTESTENSGKTEEEGEDQAEASAETDNEGEVDYTQGDKITMNVASTYPAEGYVHELMEEAKEYIEDKSGGRIEVIIHPAGALGSAREIAEGIKAGTIEAAAYGDDDIEYYCPQYSCYSAPYVFESKEHFLNFLRLSETEVFPAVEEYTGATTLAWVYRGTRDVTANVPVLEPEDLAGLKLRLPSTPLRISVFETYGASPTVVDFAELYMALKTGTVDAQENPPETIYSYKYYEAQKYLSLTNHIQNMGRYVASSTWLNSLSDTDKELILEGWHYAQEDILEKYPDPDQIYLDLIEETGMMEIVEPDIEKFIEMAAPVVEAYAEENWEPGLYELINSAKE